MAGNPFLIDLVIEIMLEEADVCIMKALRKMDSIWNQLALKELEKRALDNKLDQLGFSQEFKGEFDQFLEYTAAIPQLFTSFCLNFPKSFKLIKRSFFNKYKPIFIHLELNHKLHFSDHVIQYLVNIFRLMAPTLQEVKIERLDEKNHLDIPSSMSMTNGPPLVFHKLTRLIWDMGESYMGSKHIPFNFILDRAGAIDPTPNLKTLEACINKHFLIDNAPTVSRWSQLTIMRIECCDEDDFKFLISLCQAGMSLKIFALSMAFSLAEDMCGVLSYFFATQAKTLKVLELAWWSGFDMVDTEGVVLPKIQLPIFESLHTLHFYLSLDASTPPVPVKYRMFEIGPFSVHFPKLDHLRINKQGLLNICPKGGKPIPLKSLNITGEPGNWQAWASRIRSVESLTCRASLFSVGMAEVPWKESLKELGVFNCYEGPSIDEIKTNFSIPVKKHVQEEQFPFDYYCF